MLKKLITLLFCFALMPLHAAHLVGGEISYTCNGNNVYTIKLKVYRDCNSSGAPFDVNAYIAVFNRVTGSQVTSVSPAVSTIIQLPATVNNPCLQSPPNICTEMAIYLANVTLPPTPSGYVITYQRCCRNGTINNIPNPGAWGNTYTITIPPNDNACNNSPDIASNPPIVLCLNDSLYLNSAATELDGDSLYYEFCNPLHGGTQQAPMPVPPTAPPYIAVPFSPPFSSGYPLPANPALQINPQTGLITGKPTQVGQFVFAICVSEYRNGVLLSKVMRDYQFNVTNCQSYVDARFNMPAEICGFTATFTQQSINPTRYFWDFGEPNTNADTSVLPNPTFTFSGPGTYQVMLIINKGWPCTDTIIKTIIVKQPADASFTHSGPQCVDGTPVTFIPLGNNPSGASYSWNFGANATPASSNLRNPPPITFSSPGQHTIELTVDNDGCIQNITKIVWQYMQPTIGYSIPTSEGCAPFTVRFADSSNATSAIFYKWDFGDGTTSTLPDPTHTYTQPGVYSVRFTIYTTEGCIDTLEIFRPNYIVVKPSPEANFTVNPSKVSIYNAVVEVIQSGAQPGELFYFNMGDGTIYPNQSRFYHTFRDTGTFMVHQVVTNSSNCTDTLYIPVRVNPVPLIFAPNAFSPNGDQVNDIYIPTVVGTKEYRFIIYNRWGQVVFSTENPAEGWNGTHLNSGDACSADVYTFVIYARDVNEELIEKRGYITLIR